MNVIGIRREDKSEWEARVPLVPADVEPLIHSKGLTFHVESSTKRAFPDDDFRAVGAKVRNDLTHCPIIMGVKEIPPDKLEAGKTYMYFSHTIKGQSANMPALKGLMDLGCQLIDYECIEDDEGRRLVFFGRFAGLAGMIDTLWALGRRWHHEGHDTPLAALLPAHKYKTVDQARTAVAAAGDQIRTNGLPDALTPFVVGLAGYGQVSSGAQEILDLLPVEEVTPQDLAGLGGNGKCVYKVVFREEHLVTRREDSGAFDLQEYYDHPDRYQSSFFPHVPYLSVLVNCIFWTEKYPKLIDRDQFAELYGGTSPPRLRVIGDITCDIDGSLACTTRATDPGSPIYVFDPRTGKTTDGVVGNGPVVLAVDFLPAELPVDSSAFFSNTLAPFIPGLAEADFTGSLADSGLPGPLKRATIVYQGRLTEHYRHLERFLP